MVTPTTWLTPAEIAANVCAPGKMAPPTFSTPTTPSDWRPVTTVAVWLAESGGNPLAIGKPVWIDRYGWAVAFGLCQLLSTWHVDRGPYADVPRMTVAQCFDPAANWERAWLVMNRGRTGWNYNLGPWSAYHAGPNGEPAPYREHLSAALAGVREYVETL
jgi:hypothetical protein